MFKNYFIVAWRNLVRNPKISSINVGGLAIGVACAIMLYLYAQSEFGYDTFYTNANRIYRLYTCINLNGTASNSAKSSPPAAQVLRTQFPEVEANTLIGYEASYNMRYKDKVFRENSVYTADSNYFKVFDHQLLKGDANTALSVPYQLVVTEATAKRYFGDQDPIGKQLMVNDTVSFIVSAIMKDFPENSHFNADMFISMSTLHGKNDDNWLALWYSNFMLLKKGADANAVEQKLKAIVDKGARPQIEKLLNVRYSNLKESGNAFEMKLQPLTSIHLHSKETYGIDPNTEWGQLQHRQHFVCAHFYCHCFICTAYCCF